MTTDKRRIPSPEDPDCLKAAEEILHRHGSFQHEDNIRAAICEFLRVADLARTTEVNLEVHPATKSGRAVDLTALDTFIECKQNLGLAASGAPDQDYVDQLDNYLAESQREGKQRMGVLTDGKRWLLRWPGAGEPKLTKPYAMTLDNANQWTDLYEWLRDEALVALENIPPNRIDIEAQFGPKSPRYAQDIDTLRVLYEKARENPSIAVKRRLWEDLLRTALGEIAQGEQAMDDLFIRHTYLTTVIGIVVQASFGIDIRELAANDPHDLVLGRIFRSNTGIEGVVESDFFAWPTEVGGGPFLSALARRINRFNWLAAPENVAAILYEAVIPPDDRKRLGEYYTPDWLARAMVTELVDDPLSQRVLDPACGSGTFLTEAIAHFIWTADNNPDPKDTYTPAELLNRLRDKVIGIDIHPVAVHLARAAWVLAAKPLFDGLGGGAPSSNFSAPVYLGDSLQLRIRGDMLSGPNVPIQVGGHDNIELKFPVSLVSRAENFDNVVADVTSAIESGDDPSFVLDQAGVFESERPVLEQTIRDLQRLHAEGRNHIWAYYTRNMVRPVALSRQKVDVIIGNPPWINYNQTIKDLRTGLERLSKDVYGIWQGGRYATHQDVAGLFFTRSVDLYLEDGGIIGMVLPHSALQTGQYARWRTGVWKIGIDGGVLAVDFTHKPSWDLERLKPNTFFPVPASVAFARRVVAEGANDPPAKPLAGTVERWTGETKKQNFGRVPATITDTSQVGESPYTRRTSEGATIVPRSLHFVEPAENTAIIKAPGTVTVNPRRGSQDKAPWRDLDLSAITGQTIEETHVFDVHLGETLVPYATLEPLKAVLPIRQDKERLSKDGNPLSVLDSSGLQRRMRGRWRTVSRLWEVNRAEANKLSLLGQIDWWGKLTAQIEWQQDNGEMPVRVIYNQSGTPTAAILTNDESVVDYTLFWVACVSLAEAKYLLSIINSDTLEEAVNRYTVPNWAGRTRHLHKHLWKLPIPRFDENVNLHRELAQAGEAAAERVAEMLPELRAREEARGRSLTVTVARREIRGWLRGSAEGKAVEGLVGRLLGGGA